MTDALDSGALAGISAAASVYFSAASMGFAVLIWRYRARFNGWMAQSPQSRSDCVFHIGLLGLMINATLQRFFTTYGFLQSEWKSESLTTYIAPGYFVLSVIFGGCILWWLCLEVFGLPNSRLWWISIMLVGASAGVLINWQF